MTRETLWDALKDAAEQAEEAWVDVAVHPTDALSALKMTRITKRGAIRRALSPAQAEAHMATCLHREVGGGAVVMPWPAAQANAARVVRAALAEGEDVTFWTNASVTVGENGQTVFSSWSPATGHTIDTGVWMRSGAGEAVLWAGLDD